MPVTNEKTAIVRVVSTGHQSGDLPGMLAAGRAETGAGAA
jgi:hypothetical protein